VANLDRELSAIEKQLEALEMRKAGLPYQKIANALGYSNHSGARKAVIAAMKKTLREPAEEVRELEIARLDDLINAIWHFRAKPEYLDRILKIMERRSKLLGLDAPTKLDTHNDGEVVIKVKYERSNE
jgi:transcriptional regulator